MQKSKLKSIPWREILVAAILSVYNIAFGCPETHSNIQGIIESRNYPDGYPNDFTCKYTIKANHGNKLLLEFDEFDLEQSTDCSKDFLEFVEGFHRIKRCGNDKRPYFSQTNKVTLYFRSDSVGTSKGFRIRYKTCGGEYEDSYKYHITSPSYGLSEYPNGTDCKYKMTSIRDYGFRMVFNVFSLENSTNCRNDNFSIYERAGHNLVEKRCGKERNDIITKSSQLTARFLTNSHISDIGFNISVYACYRLMTTDRSTISSPQYPYSCDNNVFCLYDIRLPVGSKLKLEFRKINLVGDDYLKLQNSSKSSNAIFINGTNVTDVESREFGNKLYLELKCDFAPGENGFQIFYYDNQGSCSKYRPCQNGGICTDISTKARTYNCTCTLDYEGTNCTKKISPCKSNPCMNSGTCVDVPSRNNLPPTFMCTCVGDFTGQQCESKLGACRKYSPCQNNGQCTDVSKDDETYRCTCPLDFRGTRCEHFIDGCTEYRNDSRWQRSVGYNASTTFCDGSLPFSWYRFISNAGLDMPTTCPDKNSCGTAGSIWLNGTVHLQVGNETDMKVCARNSSSCCSASWDIRIKKCRGFNGTTFNVYRLRQTPSCPMAYCAGTELPCPTNYNSVNGFTPNCTEMHPQILESPRLYPEVEGNRLVFKCEFKSNTKEDVARFHVSWYEESPLRQLGKVDILKGTERVAKLQRSFNSSSGMSLFRLGKTIFCKVHSWYEGRPYGRVKGPSKESNHFFAGIKVEPSRTHYTMREASKPLRFTVIATVPIVCSLSNDCSIVVRITQDNSEVYLSLCSMRFTNGSASQVFEIAVKRDFIYGTNKQTIVKLEVENPKDPIDFINHHKIRDIVITINELVSSYSCQSYTDPYIKTFGPNRGFWQTHAGDFVLVRSSSRVFEVQARTYYCGRGISGVCNCGVAAREGNDVVVVDFCSGGPMSARFASRREPAYGTRLSMDSTGRSFSITFPSGAWISANFYLKSISLSIPAEDYATTTGDCHSQGHRVNGRSLFEYFDNAKICRDEPKKQYCICKGNPTTGYKEDCSIKSLIDRKDYYQVRGKSILLLHSTAKACNRNENKDHIVVPECCKDGLYKHNPTPTPGVTATWPTPTGKRESDAKSYCENAIRNSAVARACTVIPNFPFQDYVDQCVENVKLTDTYDFTLATVGALQEGCGNTLQGNVTHWEDNNGTMRPPQNFTETLCPNLCSGHGTCSDSICTCFENFTSIDCSIDKRKGPTLLSIRKGNTCDNRTRSDCHLVRILGNNFMVAANSACRTTKLKVTAGGHIPTSVQNLHRVGLLSFAEVLCTTSPTSASHTAYSIDVTNDGSIFSSRKMNYVVFDSNCLNCSQSSSFPQVCTIKKNTCDIGGICYSLGEASKSDPYAICNPEINQTIFTKEHFPKIKTGPRLSLVIKNKRIGFNCEFEAEKNEERARFEVTWYEGTPLKKINKTHILKGFERNVTLQNDSPFGETSLFTFGASVFCRVRTWYVNTSVSNIPGPYHESNHYFAGIKVEPNRQVHVISESGKALKLKVSVTVPIICNTGDSCRVLVEINTDNSEALLDVCMLEFKPGPANQSKIIQVAAKRDFILDGSNLMKIKFNISLKGDPVDWKRHRSISDVLIKVTDVDTRRCQSSGDPHLITYDGLYFDHYKVGTYLLAKSNCRNFEVHVRTHKCGTVSCNCGVAAREGNDVIVIDFCKGAVQTAWFASKGIPANGTKLMRDRTGKNFEIQFPSGSFVRFNVYDYAGTHYASIVVQVTSYDFRCTSGLCGTFDEDQRNDMKDLSGKIHDFMQRMPASALFTETYRVDSSKDLFKYKGTADQTKPPKPFCSCLSNSSGYPKANCNYESSQPGYIGSKEGWVQLIPPNARIGRKLGPNTAVVLSTNENPIYDHKPEEPSGIIPEWPTASGRTKLEVEAYCNDKIRNSTTGKICSQIPNFPFHLFTQQCITDIQVTDTDAFTISAIQSMQFACEEIFLKNMTFWKPRPDKNGTSEPPTDLKKEMCPGLCSGNGACANSKCKCNDQYTSDDCSVRKKTPPKIDSVGADGLCDVRKRSDCHIVRIRGSGFFENDNLACRTTKLKISQKKYLMTNERRKYNATLVSFKEILCNIGSHAVGTNHHSDRYPHDGYIIEVTNDGGIFSKAHATYLIYDSKCMECDGKNPACKQKGKTCIKSGQCYLYGEANGKYKCYPKAEAGRSTAKPSSERNILIAVGCFVGFVLLLGIVSLVGIRRKQIEDREKSKIENDNTGEFELGKINLTLCSGDEDLGGEKRLGEEVLKEDLNEDEDKVLQLKGGLEKEESRYYVFEEEEGIAICEPNELSKDEEHLCEASAAGSNTDEGERVIFKEAVIVVQSDISVDSSAEMKKVEQVDTTDNLSEDEDFGSEEVIVNNEADEKIEEPRSLGLAANYTRPHSDEESECIYVNLSGGEDDFKAAIDNPSYEGNEA